MIRLILAATLFATAAHAETAEPETSHARSLAFCGSQVATLAWFYKGVVNEGSSELKPELDGLLAMQSMLLYQVKQQGEETISVFQEMTKESVADLIEQMRGTQDEGALALSHVNINVRGCADLYLEKIEDVPGNAPKSEVK